MPILTSIGASSAKAYGFTGGAFVVPPGQEAFITAGSFTWVAPADVTSVSVVCVGGGGGSGGSTGAGGGELRYKNNISVTPGSSYTVVVGSGGTQSPTADGTASSFNTTTCVANGGIRSSGTRAGGSGGTGDGGGNGGNGETAGNSYGSGGGAGGYSGNGGDGGNHNTGATAPKAGNGGGGGGGEAYTGNNYLVAFGGGGVGILGEGTSGAAGGFGGSGGANATSPPGGEYGGGAGASNGSVNNGGAGAKGAVRIIWPGTTRQFPSTDTGNL